MLASLMVWAIVVMVMQHDDERIHLRLMSLVVIDWTSFHPS